uniref:Uncharacterized protein n=1 Tax=Chenopodium quinoa TaxID=63459 RepID=A0A803LUJ5_CHEQI
MLRNKFISQHFKHFSRSPFAYARQISSKPLLAEDHQHYVASSSVNSSDYLETKMKAMHHQQQQLSRHSNRTSIYRVPEKLRHIKPRAYAPQFISIGPYYRVELFKELNENKFASPTTLLPKRWMLPAVRRDLITLENQLPMIVLKKIFDETRTKSMEETSLEWLALCFFNPITPGDKEKRGEEDHMYRSVRELKEAGIKVRVLDSTQPLELKFERGVLRMPSLQIDNHTESFFRNIVAYEQCHHVCKPDITTYLFFLDKLINSTKDVELLHYEGVIQHTLGSNRQVAKLVNNLCIEVEHDGKESYLYDVVEDINEYSNRWSNELRREAAPAGKQGIVDWTSLVSIDPFEWFHNFVGSASKYRE